jgi:hypothetical protein
MMKKSIVVFLLLSLLLLACNQYIVIQREPAVLNSSIELSGEVTGDIYPEVRTMRMRVTGQAGNFLLVEVFGMETYAGTESVAVTDSLHGTDIYLSIVENDASGNERVYRNLRFWVGPFEKDEYYTLHLSESESAIWQDELTLRFAYGQAIDQTVSASDCYYLLSDIPFDSVSVLEREDNEVPDFDYRYWGYPDTLRFFDTDSGLLIRTGLDLSCSQTHSADYVIDNDTLRMLIELGPPDVSWCSKMVFFDYLIPNYEQQIFYYKFYLTNSDWSMFEGVYEPDRTVIDISE